MSKIQIHESSRFIESADYPDSLVVRIIREGQGSSGYYSRELLERSTDLFSNVLSFANHPANGDPTTRSFLDVVGRIHDTWYSEHEGFGAVYGRYTPMEKYRETLMELRESIGVSIFTGGEASEDEAGNIIVESFDQVDPYRSVDVVVAPGAGGSLAPLMESWRVREGFDHTGKEINMEIDDLAQKVDDLASVVAAFIESQAVEPEPETQEPDTSVEDAVAAYAAAAEAIDAADLTDSQRAALKAAAARGEDVTADIETAVTLRQEIVAEAKAAVKDQGTQYRVQESNTTPKNFTVKGWK